MIFSSESAIICTIQSINFIVFRAVKGQKCGTDFVIPVLQNILIFCFSKIGYTCIVGRAFLGLLRSIAIKQHLRIMRPKIGILKFDSFEMKASTTPNMHRTIKASSLRRNFSRSFNFDRFLFFAPVCRFLQQSVSGRSGRDSQQHSERACQIAANCDGCQNPHGR